MAGRSCPARAAGRQAATRQILTGGRQHLAAEAIFPAAAGIPGQLLAHRRGLPRTPRPRRRGRATTGSCSRSRPRLPAMRTIATTATPAPRSFVLLRPVVVVLVRRVRALNAHHRAVVHPGCRELLALLAPLPAHR